MSDLLGDRFAVREILCADRAFHAWDEAGRKDVFIKMWPESDEQGIHEISVLTGVDSPYTPKFVCSFSENGNRYLVEEWIEGETLTDFVCRKGPLPFLQSGEILKALCDGLSFLHWHKRGPIVLTDLKPDNILIRGDVEQGVFSVTIVDYEAAYRLLQTDEDASVRQTRKLGSCYYTAPEVIFGKTEVSSDLYSLGVILYYMLTGVHGYPVPGSLQSPAAEIVARCTMPDPAARYSNVGDLKESLNTAIRSIKKGKKASLAFTKNSKIRMIGNYRKYSVMVDCNSCFTSEMAHVASEILGLRTGVFAISEKGQRNLEYYFLNLDQMSRLVCEDYYPFIFDHQTLYTRTSGQWTERGLLHACSEKLFIGSSKLLLELPLRTEKDFDSFFDWCHANFDLVLFSVERQDDPVDVDRIMKYASCIITTPLSNIEDLESYRDYYVSLADSKRVMLSKVRFVAWDYYEGAAPERSRFEEIVGKELYLGEVSHSESRIRKKNRLPIEQARACQEDALQYEQIIERLIG